VGKARSAYDRIVKKKGCRRGLQPWSTFSL